MKDIILIEKPITKDEIKSIAEKKFGDLVKGVVDIKEKIMAIGAGMHADEESFLLEKGSKQENLWGINIYPELKMPDMVEFDSMINIRPRQNNHSRGVEDEQIKNQILEIIKNLVR